MMHEPHNRPQGNGMSLIHPIAGIFRGRNVLFILLVCFLAVGIIEPLRLLLLQSLTVRGSDGFSLGNLQSFFGESRLISALTNSIWVSAIVAGINILLSTMIAYGIEKLHIPGGKLVKTVSVFPLYVPSIFPALGLIYLLGSQGIVIEHLTGILPAFELYGFTGVILGCLIFTIPHGVLMLTTAMKGIDNTLYRAADTLGASELRKFLRVTLPNIKYALINTFLVVFILSLTDFGVPKILGGQVPLLATEIYKEVIGQQNFGMGAALSLLLLIPVLIAAGVDSVIRAKQKGMSGTQTALHYEFSKLQRVCVMIPVWIIALLIIAILGIVIYGSFINFWPYDLTFTLANYDFAALGFEWHAYFNSLKLAGSVAILGTTIAFIGSYLVIRSELYQGAKNMLSLLILLPIAIPGTVLGLAYLFMLNAWPAFSEFVRGNMMLITINTTVHLISVVFLTFSIHFQKMPSQYEKVGMSLGIQPLSTIRRVIMPLSAGTMLEVFFFLAINAMTTISAVIFLYSPDTVLASISILHMEESGALSSAAAMGTLIFFTCLILRGIHLTLQSLLHEK